MTQLVSHQSEEGGCLFLLHHTVAAVKKKFKDRNCIDPATFLLSSVLQVAPLFKNILVEGTGSQSNTGWTDVFRKTLLSATCVSAGPHLIEEAH